MTEDHELVRIARDLQRTIRSLDRRATELVNALAHLDLPDPPARSECPECGLTLKGPRSLLEHRYVAHNSVADPDL